MTKPQPSTTIITIYATIAIKNFMASYYRKMDVLQVAPASFNRENALYDQPSAVVSASPPSEERAGERRPLPSNSVPIHGILPVRSWEHWPRAHIVSVL